MGKTRFGHTKKGKYKLKNLKKYLGNPENTDFDSSWEYKFMVYCDLSPRIYKWMREGIKITYIDYKGHKRYYLPDFYVEVKDGEKLKRFLIEVKPLKETTEPKIPKGNISEKKLRQLKYELAAWQKNKHKWIAALEWCKNRDIIFKIVTEQQLKHIKL